VTHSYSASPGPDIPAFNRHGYNWGMSDDRKTTGPGFYIAILAALALTYLLSFGPACWINQRTKAGGRAIFATYYPLLWAANHSKVIDDAFVWYASFGAATSVTPVFENGQLVWDGLWETLKRRSGSGFRRWPASRLAPFLLPKRASMSRLNPTARSPLPACRGAWHLLRHTAAGRAGPSPLRFLSHVHSQWGQDVRLHCHRKAA